MPTHNIVLTEHQEELVEALVRSGRYPNAGEVLRDGLRLVERREMDESAKLEALRGAAQLGIAAMERGDFRDFADADALVDHLDALAARVRNGASIGE